MKENEIIKAWAWMRENNQSIPDDVLDLMKDAAIEKIQAASAPSPLQEAGWIAVEDGLPERRPKTSEDESEIPTWSKWVQCANEYGILLYACMYDHDRKIWYGYGQYLDSTEKVTHWRYMPAPPIPSK